MIIFVSKSAVRCALKVLHNRLQWKLADFEDHLLYSQHFINQYQWGAYSGDPDPQGGHKITFKGLQVDLWVKGKKQFRFLSTVCFLFHEIFTQRQNTKGEIRGNALNV